MAASEPELREGRGTLASSGGTVTAGWGSQDESSGLPDTSTAATRCPDLRWRSASMAIRSGSRAGVSSRVIMMGESVGNDTSCFVQWLRSFKRTVCPDPTATSPGWTGPPRLAPARAISA
jgi:hypothetical protein